MQPLAPATLSDALDAAAPGAALDLPRPLWGFGGVHGGLSLALLLRAMQSLVDDRPLQQVSAQFRRVLRGPFALDVSTDGLGRTAAWCHGRATQQGETAVSATALFRTAGDAPARTLAPRAPTVAPWTRCAEFAVPREFVPFAQQTEIRPAGDARPYAGGDDAELIAWIRLAGDDRAPDLARLAVLMDGLAPSYAAVLDRPVPVPTVTLSLSVGDGLRAARDPWILLRTRTHALYDDGWFTEHLDAWTPDGAHLASAEQVRRVPRAG